MRNWLLPDRYVAVTDGAAPHPLMRATLHCVPTGSSTEIPG